MLPTEFFKQDAQEVAINLLGKILRVKQDNTWLSAMIIETEAYYLREKASHASLGYTEKRKALFMCPGTLYMYYARGADSLNISCGGIGDAVLIKSGIPYFDAYASKNMLETMQMLNPPPPGHCLPRPMEKICQGQTLLCKSLGLKVVDWDQQAFDPERFFIEDVGYEPSDILTVPRLGIPEGRDEHLPYRFIDRSKAHLCTSNPLPNKKRRIITSKTQ